MPALPHDQWPVFVVSLKDDSERRAPLEKHLGEMGLRYEILDAVDARRGVPAEMEPFIDRVAAKRNLGRDMVNPEFGCALSHMLIYKRIQQDHLPGAIVLEDDAFLTDGFGPFIRSGVYRDYPILHLSFGWSRIWRWGLGRRLVAPGVFTERVLFNPGLTTGYTVSDAAARHILDRSLPLSLPADWPCCLGPLKPRLVVPRLVHEPLMKSEVSHIEQTRAEATARSRRAHPSFIRGILRRVFPQQRRHNPIPRLYWSYQIFTKWHVERRGSVHSASLDKT